MTLLKIKNYDNNYYNNEFESSFVDSYSYDSICNTLLIKFKTGEVYLYSGVPPSVAERFAITPSKGSFIHRQLKGYPYRVIST